MGLLLAFIPILYRILEKAIEWPYASINLYAYKVTLLNLSLIFTKGIDFIDFFQYSYKKDLYEWSYCKLTPDLDDTCCTEVEDTFSKRNYHVWFVKRNNGDCNECNKLLSSDVSHSWNSVFATFLMDKSIALAENDSSQNTLQMICLVYSFGLLFCSFSVVIHFWFSFSC